MLQKSKAATNGLRVLIVGEQPVTSAPSRQLPDALARYGLTFEFSHGSEHQSTRNWLRMVRNADVLVVLGYDGPDTFSIRQLALARAMGRPIVRWWVGTDVLSCMTDAEAGANAQMLDRFTAVNIAVAEHLVAELRSVAIEATMIPSIVDKDIVAVQSPPTDAGLPKGILVYLPTQRQEFYGYDVVRSAILRNPDIEFLIVADENHSLASHSNVRSLGWMSDMEEVWPLVGAVLRVTRHDGLPRLVLDALLRGRYVIYSWPLAGCWLAKSIKDVHSAIDEFRHADDLNLRGRSAAEQMLTPFPGERFANVIQRSAREPDAASRAIAAFVAAYLTVANKTPRASRQVDCPCASPHIRSPGPVDANELAAIKDS